ncbi:hypothetical protein [Micromonospora sp. NPDC005220]|uniref:hypothetical protein n=1 Tax=Micromonospora sp. NPDC005220 TaxID=3155589 RepID=UPI0033A55E83
MPIDEPVSRAGELFAAMRTLDAHWTRALDRPWRSGGCLECTNQGTCRQLDWSLGVVAEAASIMLQK